MSQINVDTIKSRTGGAPTLSQGVVVSAAATFSGNVSIAGTLTYEDVTNIDSIGIVTARTGVRVTAGGVDIAAGGLNVTGVSTFAGITTITGQTLFAKQLNVSDIITAQQGLQVLANGISVVGVSTFNGNLIFNQFANEKVNIVAGTANGNTNIDLITNGSVHYFTSNSTATWTPNFRASSAATLDSVMSTGQVVTATVISTQNNTAYYAAAVNVDGSSRTIYWSGGSAPTAGSSSGTDMYTYSILKTASNTFTVFGSATQYA